MGRRLTVIGEVAAALANLLPQHREILLADHDEQRELADRCDEPA